VFRLEVGYFGEDEGGHGRATRHWGAVLEGWLENAGNQGRHGCAREHGVAVPSWCPGRFVIARFLPVCVVFVFWHLGCICLGSWSLDNLGSNTKRCIGEHKGPRQDVFLVFFLGVRTN